MEEKPLAVYFDADNICPVVAIQSRAGKAIFLAAFEGHEEAILPYLIARIPDFVFKARRQ